MKNLWHSRRESDFNFCHALNMLISSNEKLIENFCSQNVSEGILQSDYVN